MLRSTSARWTLIALAVIVTLGVLRFKPWQLFGRDSATSSRTREELRVGFLPVT